MRNNLSLVLGKRNSTLANRLPVSSVIGSGSNRGVGHNWEGTSGGAEGDMFNEILEDVKKQGFTVSEMVTDKDGSMNAIYCRHFPEGTITYCSNHCAKTLHNDLQKVKQNKCQVFLLINVF